MLTDENIEITTIYRNREYSVHLPMQYRYVFEMAYDGTSFHGWQRQLNAPSVQETIEVALQKLASGKEISIVGCGRTDAGVHASYYVFHADFEFEIDTEQIRYKLNKMLPDSLVIFGIQQVTQEFHARFSAIARTYRYYIHTEKNPFQHYSLFLPYKPDLERMNRVAKSLLGTQDFTSLSKLHTDVKTNICSVYEVFWKEEKDGFYFEITADRFLRNMVRATVGTLLEVGIGNESEEYVAQVLQKMDRGAAGKSVSAVGLFLTDVVYPKELMTRHDD